MQQGGLGQGFAHLFPHFLDKDGLEALAGFAQLLFLLRRVNIFPAQVANARQARLNFLAGNFARSGFRRNESG